MINHRTIAASAGIIAWLAAASVPAFADAVRERQGIVTRLGTNASAVTYWVSQPTGWHVVTTIDIGNRNDADTANHAVARFEASLLPGQSQVISVPAASGTSLPELRIRRVADRIEIEQNDVTASN